MISWVTLMRPSRLIILNLIALTIYLLVSWASGSARHVYSEVFSRPDSLEYRAVADWIFGARAGTEASAWRPFLYPLMLGLAQRIGGILGIWFQNIALWFIMLNVSAAATYRFVKSNRAAALVFVVLATNISLILLTFEGLTEITVVALLAVWIYGLSHLTSRPTASQVAWALLPVSLLVVVKPEFEFLLAVVVVVLLVGIARSPGRGLATFALAACLMPVAIQLAVNVHFNGFFGISNIGEKAIRGYFLSRLDVVIGQSSDVETARLKLVGLSSLDAARLVLNHFGDAVAVFVSTLLENLLAGSNFLIHGHPSIARVILAMQATYFILLVAMIPFVGVALRRARDGRLALLCVATLNVFVAGGLTFSQGDRITIVALPLWLVAFVLAVKERSGSPESAPASTSAASRHPH
ncbi:MAG TPA: hypothetical protein VNG70_05385 [Candidatus Limnocylindria bacterium]|nr:hypothetical protein [Candidatus Limnocylindria bacterium]